MVKASYACIVKSAVIPEVATVNPEPNAFDVVPQAIEGSTRAWIGKPTNGVSIERDDKVTGLVGRFGASHSRLMLPTFDAALW